MKYFLTGATGFVGSWVAKQLVDKDEEVACLVRKTSNLRWLKDLPVEYHYGSLNDPESLKAGIKTADYVLHIGGVTKALTIDEFYKGNVEATRNILDVVMAVNPGLKKFVYVSSQAAAGPSPPNPGKAMDETAAMQPLTDYGTSKLQGEEVVLAFMPDLPITILRPPTVYGPRDTDVFEVFKNVKNRVNLKIGSHDPVVSIIHVYDLARGIIHAAEHPKSNGEVYFIANKKPCVWSEVIDILQALMDRKVVNIPVPYPVAYGFGGVVEFFSKLNGKPSILNRQKMREVNAGYWVISSQKIKEQLDFSCEISLRDGFKNSLEWYQNEGWL